MTGKQQFNTVLPPGLVRRVKHHAIDVQLSLSDLVTQVLEAYLTAKENEMSDSAAVPAGEDGTDGAAPALRLQPMVHVAEMAPAVEFYERLGGHVVHGSREGDWVLVRIGGTELGLLAHPPNPEQHEGAVELNFTCQGQLSELEERLRADGVSIARSVADEGFGRQLQLNSPDGLLVKVNELEPELYT